MQVMLVVKLISNVTIDNCGHYDFCKLRHDRKIFCWKVNIGYKQHLNYEILLGGTLLQSEAFGMLQQFGKKFPPISGEDQEKRSYLQFDGIFGRKLTFYQQFFCLTGQDALI